MRFQGLAGDHSRQIIGSTTTCVQSGVDHQGNKDSALFRRAVPANVSFVILYSYILGGDSVAGSVHSREISSVLSQYASVKMKLLITNSMPFFGGAEKWAWKLGEGLIKRGHDVSFIARSDSVLAKHLRGEHLSVRELPMRGDADPHSLLSLIRLTRAHGTDIILSTCERDFRLAGLAMRLGGRGKVIPRLRSVWPRDRRHWGKSLRFYRQRFNYTFFASRIITSSEAGKRDLLDGGWATDDMVEVACNRVALSIFDPVRVKNGAIKRELGIPQGAVVITLNARIASEKGQMLLIDVAEKLLREFPHTYYLIVGRAASLDYHDELLRRLQRSPFRHHILVTGFRNDVERILADTDILVLPSIEEGLPNAVIEAMAMKCAVVATDVCGTSEAVEDGVTGYLIPAPVSADVLLDRVRGLVKNRELRGRLGENGRRKVEEKFDFEKAVGRYEEVFRRVGSGEKSF